MHFLITGGAGFIGSHLTDALLSRGDEVTVLDNLSTGRAENLAHVEGRFRMRHGSVLDALLVDELVSDADVVVHLAAAVGVKLIVDHPLRSFVTNIRGSETVFEAAHRYRRKVLLTSTSEIYGKETSGAFHEDDDRVLGSPKVSRWAYSTAKAVDEILAFSYHRERNLPTVIARLFNTVGPRQTGAYGMVIPRFVRQALDDEPLTVHGDGQQTRCFCHVDDVVRALLLLLEAEEAEGDVFNVGSTEEVSVLEVAERVIEMTGSNSAIEMVPYKDAYERGFEDMRRRVPDITKIQSLMEWKPESTLEEILDHVIQHRRHELADSASAGAS